jgi:hypothetical protein
MKYSEGAGLYAMARFIVSKGLQRHLRAKDWASFAKGYNGSGYAKHGYHTKLAAAYGKRPASEKFIPPPATTADIAELIGQANPATAPIPTPKPAPAPPEPKSKPIASGTAAAVGGIIAALAAAGAFLSDLPCSWFGVFCGA